MLNSKELSELRSQIVTLGSSSIGNHFIHPPRVFTENGVAMLSSVFKSEVAIDVNIYHEIFHRTEKWGKCRKNNIA